jgi:putative ATP-binding cassette transporter
MTPLDFVKFLSAHIGKKWGRVILLAVLNGLCMIILMYSLQIGINRLFQSPGVSIRGFFLFVCSFGAFYLTQLIAFRIASSAAYSAIEEMELRLIDKLRRIDYESFKSLSSGDIYTALGGDKNSVIYAANTLIMALSNAVALIIALLYMATLSLTAVVLILLEFTVIVLVYKAQGIRMAKRGEIDAGMVGSFTMVLKDVVEGFAELKMNHQRSEMFYHNRIVPANKDKTESLMETSFQWLKTLVVGQSGLFIPLGLIVFVAPCFSEQVAPYVQTLMMITLIIIGPAGQITGFVSSADMANNTLARLWAIEKQLDGFNPAAAGEPPKPPDFNSLKIDNLSYTYPESGSQSGFTLRVNNFSLKKGEVLIIKGGNGSGKSTFMRVLAGLLLPGEGKILLNDEPVPAIDAAYRGLFTIVFADFHLFDAFYGIEAEEQELEYWIGIFKLQEIFQDFRSSGRLPTEALSSGQRKRTALLAAILEHRPVLLLDEVAADFDPEFRQIYYRDIIPVLKDAGRTILLVSHDDRYFDVGDRVIEFREGTNI